MEVNISISNSDQCENKSLMPVLSHIERMLSVKSQPLVRPPLPLIALIIVCSMRRSIVTLPSTCDHQTVCSPCSVYMWYSHGWCYATQSQTVGAVVLTLHNLHSGKIKIYIKCKHVIVIMTAVNRLKKHSKPAVCDAIKVISAERFAVLSTQVMCWRLCASHCQTCQPVDERWSVPVLLQEGAGVASAKEGWAQQFFTSKLQTNLELV